MPSPDEQPVLRVQGLRKAFDGRDAVRDLSLELHRGEIMGFLGTNGAGKTTTIRMLLGFLPPDAGEISIFGRAPGDPASRARIGYMPEIAYYYPFLTIGELLEFYGGLCGLSRAEVRRRAPGLIERVGLAGHERKLLKTSSKGMLQRAGIAQAILHDPDLLILDEPATGLDPLARMQFRDLLVELRNEGKTIFFSSHELSEAELICDRVAIVKDGTIVRSGSIAELAGEGDRNLERIFLDALGVERATR